MKNRRQMLTQSAALAGLAATAGWLPATALAYSKDAFDAKSVADALKAVGVTGAPTESKDVTITGPDIAENGAVVPLSVATALPGVKQFMLLVEKNPNAVVAIFNTSEFVESNFTTRAKLGQSSDVYAIAVMNDGKALFAKKEVKVTLGGCGG
ncbi:thiosulfate oxidation carrier protein SoxY [Variovorax boronicumulans]|uniref:thiosulfate oxidation carrier protein SoxY n=1 Tax=Variovorax boronicumulans TaxID=436515 RepID=UPI00085C7B76|nr:thiosulfate oxidation carrier protein SoxY [Variovorax boronicumulans]OEZ27209.1 thiosulfate oxidation carrier protein SoxY [Variovorax boronicumulans]